MRTKALFLGAMALVAVLVAFGALRESGTTSADLTQPLQPFHADLSLAGFADTTLGVTTANYTYVHEPVGVRISIPWIFNGPGYITPSEAEGPGIGNQLAGGSGIRTVLDVLCDGVYDYMVPNLDINEKYPWLETTTAAKGTDAEFLYAQVPPYPWIFRDTASPNHFLLNGSAQIAATVVLNTVYTVLPFSPNGGSGTATTKNNGNPHTITTAESVCIDSPENTTSLTAVNTNPPLLGDTGGGCTGGVGSGCADAAVYGPLTADTISGSQTVAVTANYLDRGASDGTFTATMELELTNPGIMTAVWSTGGHVSDVTTPLTVGTTQADSRNMVVACTGAGEGLVVIKDVLWPQTGTHDNYVADNANVFITKVVCGSAGSPLVDKQVIEVVPVAIGATAMDSTPYQVNLVDGQSALLTIKEVKANNSTVATVPGHEWLSAEAAPAPAGHPTWVISRSWGAAVDVTPAWGTVQHLTANNGSTDTIDFAYAEPKGQSTALANLTVDCPVGMPEGRYSVVVKAIDAPDAPYGEANPADNAQRFVIAVNCWTSSGDMVGDGVDDGTGLYTRWTIFQSNPDARLTFASPPAFPSDDGMDTKGQNPSGGYIERTLDMECFWHDANGCALGTCDTTGPDSLGNPGGPADGFIDAAESRADPDLAALGGWTAIDADHDCLVDQGAPGTALQPGRPVDLATKAGTCSAFQWAGAPEQALQTYSNAADQDCDGVPDGVEVAYGSNPVVADSDSDGATDYQEMFDFTNPNNPDTDGDTFKDAPSGVFGNNTSTAVDNCPSVYNPTQLNSDGKHRPIGILDTNAIATTAGPPGTLTEAGAAWTANQWAGQAVFCVQADGVTVKGKLTVASNTATVLTGTAAWTGTYPNSLCPGGIVFNTIALAGKNGTLNPNKDRQGDACDPDNDNDGVPDVVETYVGPNTSDPLNPDTNGNHCVDGSETYLGLNPQTAGHNCPISLTLGQAKFFRACTWNVPPLGAYGAQWNDTYSGGVNAASRVELDPDGDGVSCVSGTNVGDKDNDNGTGTLAAAQAEVSDVTEITGYNTNPALKDTDGDGCYDFVQINDVTGDGKVDPTDLLEVALAINTHPNAASNQVLDVDKNNKFNTSDLLQVAGNLCAIKNFGGCNATPCKTSLY